MRCCFEIITLQPLTIDTKRSELISDESLSSVWQSERCHLKKHEQHKWKLETPMGLTKAPCIVDNPWGRHIFLEKRREMDRQEVLECVYPNVA